MIYVLIALAICCINYIWWSGLVWKTKKDLESAELEYLVYRTYKAQLRLCGYEAKLHRQEMWLGFWAILAFVCVIIWSCSYYG